MKKILLFGDSLIQWNPLCHTDVENIGKAGIGLDEGIEIAKKIQVKYEKIFVLIGVNDINKGVDNKRILENFNELMKILREKTEELFLFSLLPTKLPSHNSVIEQLNLDLKKLSKDETIEFLDCYAYFLDEKGILSNKYSTDTLHLNDLGYVLLNSFIGNKIYNKNFMDNVKNRFLEYIKWHTTSSTKNKNSPSTIGQYFFANFLKEELINIGMTEVEVSEYAYVTASLKSNMDIDTKKLAFIAHMDTSPDMNGKNIKSKIWENYDGSDLILNENTILSPQEFPDLNNYIGKEIITTDGDSLLGADNKAGIAEIITAIDYLIKNPHIKHGEIKVAFSPDEEIGAGCEKLDIKSFGADYAYTIDGGAIGELEYENFNASSLVLKIKGRSVHPGAAKNKMINASQITIEFENMLPVEQKPQYTEGYEGFIMLTSIIAGVEDAKLEYIIRDHDKEKFQEKKEIINNAINFLKLKYPNAEFTWDIKDSYYNMKEKIEPCMFLIDIAKDVIKNLGIEPIVSPVRGGTDGARLSYAGLPCPNIFTGAHNFHGRYEYVVRESMEASVKVIIGIIENFYKTTEAYNEK